MTVSRKLTGECPQAFPRKAQPVANWGSFADPSSDQTLRLRLVNRVALATLGEHFVRVQPVLSIFAASLIALASCCGEAASVMPAGISNSAASSLRTSNSVMSLTTITGLASLLSGSLNVMR